MGPFVIREFVDVINVVVVVVVVVFVVVEVVVVVVVVEVSSLASSRSWSKSFIQSSSDFLDEVESDTENQTIKMMHETAAINPIILESTFSVE